MSYGKRIDTLCFLLERAEVFADVGCDHGYCSEYMLKTGKCSHAILSDISKGSLAKAERLLASYIQDGRAEAVIGDGFEGVPKTVDEVLIAGMGGCEIVSILTHEKYGFLPERFVFQPMHNADKLRRCVLDMGGYIERDFTFRDCRKFYDVIAGRRRTEKDPMQEYMAAEFEFGRENLARRGKEFLERIEILLHNAEKYLADGELQNAARAELEERKSRLKGVLNGEIK